MALKFLSVVQPGDMAGDERAGQVHHIGDERRVATDALALVPILHG